MPWLRLYSLLFIHSRLLYSYSYTQKAKSSLLWEQLNAEG